MIAVAMAAVGTAAHGQTSDWVLVDANDEMVIAYDQGRISQQGSNRVVWALKLYGSVQTTPKGEEYHYAVERVAIDCVEDRFSLRAFSVYRRGLGRPVEDYDVFSTRGDSWNYAVPPSFAHSLVSMVCSSEKQESFGITSPVEFEGLMRGFLDEPD
ncbi:MAG: hypothetical protein DWQ53_09850 [Microcystis flos-aquae DF17]|nr:MAG: hypothetical protein DWQ53_09850 [Microcystis flos-aquae DF17]